MCSTRRALVFACIDALLDAFPTKAVIIIWVVYMCISTNIKANWTLEFILYEIIEQQIRLRQYSVLCSQEETRDP